MMRDFAALVDALASDLEPVRPLRPAQGRWLMVASVILTCLSVTTLYGLDPDLSAGRPEGVTLVAAGLFVLVAGAAGSLATRAARPAVGAASGGLRWIVAALMVLPLAAAAGVALRPSLAAGLSMGMGLSCLTTGLTASVLTAVVMTAWMRRGAPTSGTRTAWLIGLASGAAGALAVTLECPLDALTHIGVWHAAIPLAGAIAGRMVLPPLLRW